MPPAVMYVILLVKIVKVIVIVIMAAEAAEMVVAIAAVALVVMLVEKDMTLVQEDGNQPVFIKKIFKIIFKTLLN
jgi:hypothetical protein